MLPANAKRARRKLKPNVRRKKNASVLNKA